MPEPLNDLELEKSCFAIVSACARSARKKKAIGVLPGGDGASPTLIDRAGAAGAWCITAKIAELEEGVG